MGMSLKVFRDKPEIAQFDYDLSGLQEVYEELLRAQDEVGGTVIYRAKVAAGGGKNFDIITGDESQDVSVPTITGVIIHNHKCNARFADGSASTEPPICSSIDGNVGINRDDGEYTDCATCPYNEYGTAENGRGKACKNMHRLYILTEGLPIPIILTLPPTSLKAWRNYRLATLAVQKLDPTRVVTEMSLKAETSADGNKYSVVQFKLMGRLASDTAAVASFFARGLESDSQITGDDYNRIEAPKTTENGEPDENASA